MLSIIALGLLAGRLLDLGFHASLYLGCIMAISSTMVVVKLLDARGEMNSLHGRAIIGILVVQDLAAVAMATILPALSNATYEPIRVILSGLKAGMILVGAYYLARVTLPHLMTRIVQTRSGELFLMINLGMVMGIALFTYLLGLSISLGAFLAGLIISESKFSYEALAKIMPLRDIFVILFFVSIGMLIDPLILVEKFRLLATVVMLIILGKFIVIPLIFKAYNYGTKASLYAGAAMVQIGEFSFVLAKLGLDTGAITNELYSVTLESALVTILVTPILLNAVPRLHGAMTKLGFEERHIEHVSRAKKDHVIVCGYGRVGRTLGKALSDMGFDFFVIDHDHMVIEELHRKGIECIYGDASNEEILKRADPSTARLALIALPDTFTARTTIRNLLSLNPSIKIIARAHGDLDREAFYEEGVTEVVQPEYEAGVEMARHMLLGLAKQKGDVQRYIDGLRKGQYTHLLEEWVHIELTTTHKLKELIIGETSQLNGLTIEKSNIKETTGVMVIAVRRSTGELITNPPPETQLRIGNSIIVLGTEEQIALLEQKI